METHLTQVPEMAQTELAMWKSALWYNALSLTERLPIAPECLADSAASEQESTGRAQRRFQRWKKQYPFEVGSRFAQRLASDGMTEETPLSLLLESPDALQARLHSSNTLPAWLEQLRSALCTDAFAEKDNVAHPMPSLAPFLRPLRPLLKAHIDHLYTHIDGLAQHYTPLPFDVYTVVELLFEHLSRQLLEKITRTFVLELNVARVQGHLQGETAEERFESFLQRVSTPDGLLALLTEYSVLARAIEENLQRWEVVSLELLERLCADWQEICSLFTPERAPGVLAKVRGGAGDTHRGGRSVMLLTFDSGFQLAYKPKSLSIDVHFQELLTWLNMHGTHPPLRILTLLDRGSYGWSEFVAPADCTTEEQVQRFYERQGCYLALLYALNATDFHYENVIAVGENPILIDLETLFHPWFSIPDGDMYIHPADIGRARSVEHIGLLPRRRWSRDGHLGLDDSGLGGESGQITPYEISRWEGAGTDQMHVVKKQTEVTVKQNRPRLRGNDVRTVEYRDNVIAGFTNTYHLLMEQRETLCNEWLPRFASDDIRVVARSTARYAFLLADSFHPNMLRDALERDRLFDRLWDGVIGQPLLAKPISAERADLLNGDVPMFTTHPGSRDLYTSRGERIADFLAEPSLEAAQRHLAHLDYDDLARQCWIIRATFAMLTRANDAFPKKSLSLKLTYQRADAQRLLKAAEEVGQRLSQLAFSNEYGVGWLSAEFVQEGEWAVQGANSSMYSGVAGIVFFLSYLGSITGEPHYTTLSKATLRAVRNEMQEAQKNPAAFRIGAFHGLGGLIYLFTHLAVLWNESALLEEAIEIVEFLPPLIAQDEGFDLISGSAGCIASLLSLYAVRPSPCILEVAIQCGEHLLAHTQPIAEGQGWCIAGQERPLTGFSHGSAGIALSLFRLAALSGQERFHLAANAALAYERSLFSPAHQNWPDLRKVSRESEPEAEGQAKFMHAWCHGAPGIGLSRLAALRYADDELLRAEIASALQSTLKHGFGRNHSLCHGDLGNLETLLVAAQMPEYASYQQAFEHLTMMLLESIESGGYVTGVQPGVEVPELMTGLAGIGYELLRLAMPERIPSVLLLEPPVVWSLGSINGGRTCQNHLS